MFNNIFLSTIFALANDIKKYFIYALSSKYSKYECTDSVLQSLYRLVGIFAVCSAAATEQTDQVCRDQIPSADHQLRRLLSMLGQVQLHEVNYTPRSNF